MPPLEAQELAGLITHALAQPDRDDFAAAGATLTVPVVPPIAGGSGPVVADEALTVQLSTIEPESIEWLWPGRIPQRKLTLFCGDAGVGKSFLTLDIAARTTRGIAWPGSTEVPEVGDVVLLSAEDGLADTIRPRIDAMGGDASRIWALKMDQSFALDKDIPRLRDEVRKRRAVLVIIDPLSSYMGRADSWKDTIVRDVLRPLAALADSEHVAITGVMHPSKADQQKAVHGAGGSVAFVAVPRMAYLVAEDPQDPERSLVATIKCNIAVKPPTVAYRLESVGEVARVVWEMAPLTLTAQQLISTPTAEAPQPALEDAKEFLAEVLKDGKVLYSEVKRKATAAGIAMRTVERAKDGLGVKSKRLSGLGGDGAWAWSLPSDT